MHIFDYPAVYISYNPHTIQGTWTIIITAIVSVFTILITLRLLAPVAPSPITTDGELDDLTAELRIQPSAPDPATKEI